MGDRRRARELALQALFSFDINKSDSCEDFEEFCINNKKALTPGVMPFFQELVNGVRENYSKIDKLLNKYSKNWKLTRMAIVDRNIMRIAIFEFMKDEDIPDKVTINEAVEIGKKFGTDDSGSFINGILDEIKSLEKFG